MSGEQLSGSGRAEDLSPGWLVAEAALSMSTGTLAGIGLYQFTHNSLLALGVGISLAALRIGRYRWR